MSLSSHLKKEMVMASCVTSNKRGALRGIKESDGLSPSNVKEIFTTFEDQLKQKVIDSVKFTLLKEVDKPGFQQWDGISLKVVFDEESHAFSVYKYANETFLLLFAKAQSIIKKIPRVEVVEEGFCCKPSVRIVTKRDVDEKFDDLFKSIVIKSVHTFTVLFTTTRCEVTLDKWCRGIIPYGNSSDEIFKYITFKVYNYINEIFQ